MVRPKQVSLVALFLFLIGTQSLQAQDGRELFQKGFEAQQNGSYRTALDLYGQAIEKNDTIKEAFYNRASVRIALKRYDKAKEDLDRTLRLDPDYVPAFFNRANIHTQDGYYEKAEADLNEVLARKKDHGEAFLLRGQVRQHLGKDKEGCRDLQQAKTLGQEKAKQYIERSCNKEDPLDLESRWPDLNGWSIGNRKEDRDMKKIELLPEGESREDWKKLASVMALKNVRGIPMDTARFFLAKQAQGKCDGLRTKTLEKVENEEERYIFFTLHCTEHINTEEAETQFWYVEQGEQHLYAYFVATKELRMSSEQKEKWMRFFKARKE